MRIRSVSLVLVTCIFLASSGTAQQDLVLVNYGQRWNGWSADRHWVYLEGFIDGQSGTFFRLSKEIPPERVQPLREESFVVYDVGVLADVITSLYADPANTYINFESMIYIARDKLSGKDIDIRLRRAREQDRGYTKAK